MSSEDVFGNILVPQRLENATKLLLQLWFPTYLREVENQQDLTSGSIKVPDPRNYTSRNKFDALEGEDIPKVVVISPGLIGAPILDGSRKYRATWRLGVGVATAASTEEEAKLQSDIYGAAARGIMLQHGGGALGGKVHWLDEQYVDLPISNQITQYRAVAVWFGIDIEGVASKRGGPTEPNAEPYTYGTVDEVIIDLEKE